MPPHQAKADFSDSDDAVGYDETTTTTAAPSQNLPEYQASPLNHDNLKSSDEEAIDAIHDDNDDLRTSNKEAIDSLSNDQ